MTSPQTRRVAALLAAALSLAALAVARGSDGGPPLYDGLCVPQAYVMLGATPAPASVNVTYTMSQLAQTQQLQTPEGPPAQAQLTIAAGTLSAAPGATTVTVAIRAVTPPAPPPAGVFDGNVYEFSARSRGGEVRAAPGHPVTIGLLAATAVPRPLTIESFDGSRWTGLRTVSSSCVSFNDAAAPSLGLFALVDTEAPRPGGGSAGTAVVAVIVVAAGCLLLLGLATRLHRRRPDRVG